MTEARVDARVVAPRRGWQWLFEGFWLFRKSPVIWLALTIVLGLLWYVVDAWVLAPIERATGQRWGLVTR